MKKLRAFLKKIDEDDIFLLSGSLTFFFAICIFPLILIILYVLGLIFESSSLTKQLCFFVEKIIPSPEQAEQIKNIILSRIGELLESKNKAGYLGIIGLFIGASGLFGIIRKILNKVFTIKSKSHPLKNKLKDFGMIFITLIFFLLLFLLPSLSFIKSLIHAMEITETPNYLNYLNPKISNIVNLIIPLITLLICFIFYYLIPNERPSKRVAFLSAICATVLWEIAKYIFAYYIREFSNLNYIYGTYVSFVIIAFWFYYSSFVFILSAEIGCLLQKKI